MQRLPTDLSVAGTLSPSVLRCRIVAPYVPLRTKCSESVPTADRFVNDRVILLTEFCKRLYTGQIRSVRPEIPCEVFPETADSTGAIPDAHSR